MVLWSTPPLLISVLTKCSVKLTKFTNPTMHLSHIPQCTIQDRNVHISVLNGALWDMGQVHCRICEIVLLESHNAPVPHPTVHHSEQKCAHFCSEWCIVGYGTGALWDLWDCAHYCSEWSIVGYGTGAWWDLWDCAHFCSEWSIVGNGTGALWDLWDWSIRCHFFFQGLTALPDYIQFKEWPGVPFNQIFTAASDDVLNLLYSMLTQNPQKRCTASQVNILHRLMHEFYQSIFLMGIYCYTFLFLFVT